uniref:ADAM_spacer1 domain-containing protein n=1 Tax=Elaeophora elaphi TaxID=1147741 RepID=A0A0R3RWE6_9BILA
MLIIVTFSLLHTSLLWNVVSSLECYTGFSIIRGQTVGTTKEVCSKQSDSCYRAMADINLLSSVKKAGCSTLRCYVSFNLPSSCPMKPEWKKFTAVRKSESKVHPNMKVTREIQVNGKSIESKYAGEYVYMSGEGQAMFINYTPDGQSHHSNEFPVHVCQVHTPTAYNGDDCLSRHWAEVIQKLAHFAQTNREENR